MGETPSDFHGGELPPSRSRISVVIPAYNAADDLRACLASIRSGRTQPFECIVVDDGSTDNTVEVAVAHGARVLTTGGRTGPAAARNLGASQARGSVLFFLDADVCAHEDTLARVQGAFVENPKLDAIIGSYDDTPTCQDFLSQYRNLMHRYTHREGCRVASTFWTGCGAIRRDLFLKTGGFDANYRRPAIEDIELGYRLRAAGCTLFLDPEIQVKHRKRWTFSNIVRTDVLDRGIPWTVLILRSGRMPNDLNLRWHQRASVVLVLLIVLAALAASFFDHGKFLTPLLGLLMLILGTYWIGAAFEDDGKVVGFSLLAALGLFTLLAVLMGKLTLLGFVWGGYIILLIRQLLRRRHKLYESVGWIYGAYFLAALVEVFSHTPRRPAVLIFIGLVFVLIALNLRFYIFLFSHLGKLAAVAAIPFHVLYFLYSGISFMWGLFRFRRDRHNKVRAQRSVGKG